MSKNHNPFKQTFKFAIYIPLFIIFIPIGLIYKANKWALDKVSDFDL